jgi:pyruvate,orthophosphate dikinase
MAGLDYVSCSPFRVPIARVAAAQAALRLGPGELDAFADDDARRSTPMTTSAAR